YFTPSGQPYYSATRLRVGYTGREMLVNTWGGLGAGLYDYRNRIYSTTIGRFLQPDPIGFDAKDVNWYRYVRNNAVNWRDPSGLVPVWFWPFLEKTAVVLTLVLAGKEASEKINGWSSRGGGGNDNGGGGGDSMEYCERYIKEKESMCNDVVMSLKIECAKRNMDYKTSDHTYTCHPFSITLPCDGHCVRKCDK
ncbi:MAG: RHS repeat-associated core domain-containing protein, partial [Methylacidiphilales bacterium]|nr:RHS repeat-associated core domain-containing protein [Candidatus Methylacidiphilales bacterium]